MIAPPNFDAKARAGWGDALPDWIAALAAAANESSLSAVARRLGYSTATLSLVISGVYKGDLGKLADKIAGLYMGATVACPVLGEMTRHACIDAQSRPIAATRAHRLRMYRACRSGCAHSKHTKEPL